MAHDITVHGGSGGSRARTEDLEAFAGELQEISREVAGILVRIGGGEHDPVLEASTVLAPVTAVEVGLAAAEFVRGSVGVAGRLAVTGTSLGAAVLGYRSAEEFAARVFDRVLTGAGAALGVLVRTSLPILAPMLLRAAVPTALVLVVADRLGIDEALESALGVELPEITAAGLQRLGSEIVEDSTGVEVVVEHVLPGFVAGVVGIPPGIQARFGDRGPWPHDSQSVTAWVLAAGRAGGWFGRTRVEVEHSVRAPDRRPAAAPAHVSELFARTLAGHRGRENGRVQIERIRGSDGTVRWIVHVPATTDWSARTGGNGTDLTTNVEGAAGHDTVMRETVRRAVEQAGIPPGEETLLVGYSQGGITAASLAADPEFLAAVRVTGLLTVASPVSDFAVPSQVSTLSIEHEQDVVPDLDGNRNPDLPHWTTITVDLDDSELRADPMFADRSPEEVEQALANPGFAHGGDVYASTIERLRRDGHPAVVRWTDSVAGFFDGEVESVQDSVGVRR